MLFAGHGVLIPAKQKKFSPHSRHLLSYRENPGRHVQSELAAETAGELLCSVHSSLRSWPGQNVFAAQEVHPECIDVEVVGVRDSEGGSDVVSGPGA